MHRRTFLLGAAFLMAISATGANADALQDEIAPTGKLRVAIAISPAGGAFWSTQKSEAVYAGVPVTLGTAMARELGIPVEFVVHQNSGQIVDATVKGTWDVTFLPQDRERMSKMAFGPIYEVADATYIVKSGSNVTNFSELDREGTKIAAVNNTTTMRGAIGHLKHASVTGYQTYDEIFGLLKSGDIDALRCRAINSTRWRSAFPGRACLTRRSSKPRPR